MIKENIARIRQHIDQACARSAQGARAITLVAVSKGRDVSEIREAVEAGIFDIGENRVQEALLKSRELSTIGYRPSTIKWHMIGHLQTNKVKDAVRIFDLIHSVDSMRLAEAIDKEAAKLAKVQDVLIEVKTSPEATKFGIAPEGTGQFLREIVKFKNIRVNGLMTIAPIAGNPEKARSYFRMLSELRLKLSTVNCELSTLSMGMSDDFELAIEEGATMVRIGRAIFEE